MGAISLLFASRLAPAELMAFTQVVACYTSQRRLEARHDDFARASRGALFCREGPADCRNNARAPRIGGGRELASSHLVSSDAVLSALSA